MSSNINAIVSSIKHSLNEKMFFEFSQCGHNVTIKKKMLRPTEAFTHLESLSRYTLNILQTTDIRSLPSIEKKDEIRDLVDVVYRCAKVFERQFGQICKDEAHCLYLQSLSAKLGGRISADVLKDPKYKEFYSFIHANFLHHKMQTLGHQMGLLPSLMIEGYHESIFWASLHKELIDPLNPDSGYVFTYGGKEVFRTDKKFVLDANYSYLDGKIVKYNPLTSNEVRYYDHEAPSPGVFKFELWTAITDVEGEHPTIALGDHSYFVLVDDQGNRLGAGQFGMTGEMNCIEMLSPLGRKPGGIETPDRYLFLPKDNYSFKKTEFILPKADFETIFQEVKNIKADSHHVVSLLHNNCTSFAQKLLARVGVKIESKIHILELLLRKVVPASVCSFFKNVFAKVPQGIKKALYFLPFIYVPTLVAAFVIRSFSLRNYRSDNTYNSVFEFFFKPWVSSSDTSLINIIFRPWRLTADHPFAVRMWQNEHASQINHLPDASVPRGDYV
jgi:hypothetical protein